jgi:ABC-type multidrug transport system fused ATPase/permease subunit
MKIIHESLKGIRVIKAYAWENSFLNLIFGIRKDEVKYVRYYLATRASTSSLTQSVPSFALIISLIAYALLGNELTASRILPSLALFYALRVPMLFLPIAIGLIIDAWIASERVGSLLDAEELQNQPSFGSSNGEVAVKVKSATFAWDTNEDSASAQLQDVNLEIPQGRLVGIVGSVGSGKSSLLQGLIGEMPRMKGTVDFFGTVGYCQQQAWIQNATLRDNILFGLPYDESRYRRVIRACALERDISILAGGDLTEIGENGINLSGGQKQRLSLARAVYSNSDILLFDDPLSAVDAHVGKHLFEQCIKKELASKTRILVTHQLHFIAEVDWIIVMDQGKVVAQGTYSELMECNDYFATLMNSYHGVEGPDEIADQEVGKIQSLPPLDVKQVSKESLNEKGDGKLLITKEERMTGEVKNTVVYQYAKFAGGSIVILLFGLWIFTANAGRIVTDQWLVFWIGNVFSLSRGEYLGYYVLFGIVQLTFTLFYGFSVAYFGAKASKGMHNQALVSIFKSPVSFFDSTPLGRITSRFSRDIDTLDTILPESLRAFLWTLAMCFFNLLLISFYLPAFLGPAALAVILYYVLQKFYRSTARELKRLDSVSRSPVISLISETLIGLTTIRSFHAGERFMSKFVSYLNNNNRPLYLILLTQRWIQLRLELLNSTLVLASTLFSIAFRNQVSVGTTGILVAYALQVTATFSWTIKTGTDVETYLNCAERMIHYSQNIESERPAIIEKNRAPSSWPSRGQVSIRNLNLRYRSDLPLVLQGMNVEIEAGSKVGIIGRTGAGKSTILTALLRIVEHDSGSIWIDGINISELGLEDVRSRIAVIPQEPVLFSGTLRFNLDPFSNYSGILK